MKRQHAKHREQYLKELKQQEIRRKQQENMKDLLTVAMKLEHEEEEEDTQCSKEEVIKDDHLADVIKSTQDCKQNRKLVFRCRKSKKGKKKQREEMKV